VEIKVGDWVRCRCQSHCDWRGIITAVNDYEAEGVGYFLSSGCSLSLSDNLNLKSLTVFDPPDILKLEYTKYLIRKATTNDDL
jgi:hypothetical protein